MTKEEFKFSDEQVDAKLYGDKFAELSNDAENLVTCGKLLKGYGLPISEEFVTKHLLEEQPLRNYCNSVAKQRIEDAGGYFATDTDKEKILSECRSMFNDLKVALPVLQMAFVRKKIKFTITEDSYVIDMNYIKKACRLFATYHVDGKALEEYHTKCKKMAALRADLKKYEDAHAINQHFASGELYNYSDTFGNTDVLKSLQIDTFFGGQSAEKDTEEMWVKVFGKQFRTNGAKKESKQ
jgi:hypothetical protein